MGIKVSIVVPVYNVEKYLDKCLYSLANQTLDDYEVIVVNDGSPDNSQQIIDRYVKEYPEIIRSFIKENGGLSSARNFGMSKARGEYLGFSDSDDYVELDYFKGMYDLAKANDYDLVVADLEYYWESGERKPFIQKGLREGVSDDIKKSTMLSPLNTNNKLFNRKFFNSLNLEFPIGMWHEDIPVIMQVIARAKSIGYYSRVGMHYTQRSDSSSIMGSKYNVKMYDLFTVMKGVVNSFKELGIYDTYKDELEYLFIEHFLLYGAFRFMRTDHYKELMAESFKTVRDYFPDYLNNRYFKLLPKKYQLFIKTNKMSTLSLWKFYLERRGN